MPETEQQKVEREYRVKHEFNKKKTEKAYDDAPRGEKGLAALNQILDNAQLIIDEQQSALNHLRENLPEIVAAIKADAPLQS